MLFNSLTEKHYGVRVFSTHTVVVNHLVPEDYLSCHHQSDPGGPVLAGFSAKIGLVKWILGGTDFGVTGVKKLAGAKSWLQARLQGRV